MIEEVNNLDLESPRARSQHGRSKTLKSGISGQSHSLILQIYRIFDEIHNAAAKRQAIYSSIHN